MKDASITYDLTTDEQTRRLRLNKALIAKAVPVNEKLRNSKRKIHTSRALNDDDNVDKEFGIDLSGYSLKYMSCVSLSFFDGTEQGGENEDNLFVSQTFVMLRLCPSDSCSESTSTGCTSDYGEYMISVLDYFEAYTQFNELVFEQYCGYCETCMYFENYFYGNRNLDEAEAEEYQEYATDDDSSSHACKYYDECVDYKKVCGGEDYYGRDDDVEEVEYEAFFECERVDALYYDDDNNKEVFLGLYCDPSDDKTITIAMFSDEFCTNLVEDTDIYNITGLNITDDALEDYYAPTCLSCSESNLPYAVPEWDTEDEDDITELCEEVYRNSAQCNANFDDFNWWNDDDDNDNNRGINAELNDEINCDYISRIINKEYTENGFLFPKAGLSSWKDWITTGYGEVSFVNLIGLVAGLIGCLTLWNISLVYKCKMKGALEKQGNDKLLDREVSLWLQPPVKEREPIGRPPTFDMVEYARNQCKKENAYVTKPSQVEIVTTNGYAIS